MLFVDSAVYPRFRVLYQPAATTDVAVVVFSYAKVPRGAGICVTSSIPLGLGVMLIE
jgi:hypothetical protein